ncbi:RNA polymerase sigma factor [Sphingomonas abietis]|uniref:Sigma-70 family RNA polymerase sigma factor n=1 Tax=Sphingomonas abietis TaxID=3012344 RepID=A0ABY7NMX4_9SPHN|nr:sigma-70 family RNA polymerase sigma factor [Sphingomonas abietis]WBO22868.1 sigma-70 family RNA polymerase sigma factor [Sphingomonas abietis]
MPDAAKQLRLPEAPEPRPLATLEIVFRDQRRGLHRYFRRKLGDDGAADLVQDAFARAMAAPQFASVDNPAAYIWRIAHNLMADHGRRRKTGLLDCLNLDDQPDPVAPPEQAWRIEAEELLGHIVSGLPKRAREAFLMRCGQGLSYRQISERLGISVKGVEYHLAHARRRCRRVLALLESDTPLKRLADRQKR